MSRTLTRNSATCLRCGDEIESASPHDFRSCACGALFVDGGLDYVRRGFTPDVDWEDTSTYAEDE